jgi:cysteine-rich repeat protein
MRATSALLWGSFAALSGCFVDFTGEGGADGKGGGSTSVFMSGGAGQGGAPDGGGGGGGAGGGTTTGMGGSTCGDGTIQPTEDCDDGNLEPGDGCSDGCAAEMSDGCVTVPSSFSLLDEAHPEIVVMGDTTGQTDDFRLGDDGSCQSDGPDQWLAVRLQTGGTVRASLVATAGFGGSQDKAVLHVRRGCDQLYEQELLCVDTSADPPGSTFVDFFVRAGDVVHFGVDAIGAGDDGQYTLTIQQISSCADDTIEGLEQCKPGDAGCEGCMRTDCMGSILGPGFYGQTSKRCYVGSLDVVDWFTARERCVLAGGDLVSILPANAMEVPPISGIEHWVGLADLRADDADNTFRWLADGSSAMLGLAPSEGLDKLRCVMRNAGGTTDDLVCDQARGFLCAIALDNP